MHFDNNPSMPTHIIMPALGVAQQTGTLLKWLKKEGQSVAKGEPVMEIETDKATVEIEAPATGILTQVIAQPGDEVPVGTRIALILAPGESASAATLISSQSARKKVPAAKKQQHRARPLSVSKRVGVIVISWHPAQARRQKYQGQ
jgi:pyruvate dehydrogenase E2 component (dihydrolipoamide acetyltransferase)